MRTGEFDYYSVVLSASLALVTVYLAWKCRCMGIAWDTLPAGLEM